jgi:hypothetical protein
MNQQDVQLIIKFAKKLVSYSQLQGDKEAHPLENEYSDPRLGVIHTGKNIEIWVKKTPDDRPTAENRVFYAMNLDGVNYLLMVFRSGLWPKYLRQIVEKEEKPAFANIDDKELFPELEQA